MLLDPLHELFLRPNLILSASLKHPLVHPCNRLTLLGKSLFELASIVLTSHLHYCVKNRIVALQAAIAASETLKQIRLLCTRGC